MLPRPRRTHGPRFHLLAIPAGLVVLAVAASGTGFGATQAPTTASTTLVGTLSLSAPSGLATTNPICTKQVAKDDTDGCSATFAAGQVGNLKLGSLSGTDVEAGSLTWRVSTTHPTGYVVQLSNPGPAPVMRSSGGAIADAPDVPVAASAFDDATRFGVAIGDAATDGEEAVAFAGSPWVTASGQQGELFRSVPTGGVVVAQRIDARANDPITATFAAASIASAAPAEGSYSGTVQLTASVL